MKFKCIQSGNTVEFFQEHEIAEMRKHGGYTEVPEVREVVEVTPPIATAKSTKKVAKDEINIGGESADSSN